MNNVTSSELFELEIGLPDDRIEGRGRRLIGFPERYERLRRELRLLLDLEGVEA